jgi:hypothetical protein
MPKRGVVLHLLMALALCYFSRSACGQNPSLLHNSDVIRKSVVFLHIKDAGGNLKEVGTGFLLQVPLRTDPQHAYWVLATARHMVDPVWAGCPGADPRQTVYAVLNKKTYDPAVDSTGIVEVSLGGDLSMWKFPSDDSVDIAVIVLNGQAFASLAVENVPLPISQLPKKSELEQIDTGADILSAGLLLGVSGTKRNYPVFKFGHVSSKPEEKINMACCPNCPAIAQTEWIIAASLVPGNSGSPIVYMPDVFTSGRRPFLLGVQSSAMLGDDVAGMAPVSFLIDAIQRVGLTDADLSSVIPDTGQVTPSNGAPIGPAIPGPTKHQ